MADFIAEVIGQEGSDEGNLVTVRVTGFGGIDGPTMTRAKARAIAVTRFGPETASFTRTTDIEGEFSQKKEDIFAEKSESLFTGAISGVRDRLQAFRKEGLFAEVKMSKEIPTERVLADEALEEEFGVLAGTVSTYEYVILVTTKFSIN